MKKKIFSILFALVLVCSFSLMTAVPVGAQSLEVTNISIGTWTHIDTAEEERYIEAVKGENVLFWNDGTQLRRATYTWDGTTLTLGTVTSPTGLTYSSGINDPHNVFRTPNVLNNGEGNLEGYFQPRGGTANGVFRATSTDNGASWTLDTPLANFHPSSGESLDGSILLPNDDVGPVYNAHDATGANQVCGVNGIIESGGERRLYGENRFGDVMLWTCAASNNGPFTRTAVLIDNHTDGSPVMENVAPSGDAIELGTGDVVYFYNDGNFYKPWDNEANEGAVGVLVLNAAGDDFIYQQHDFVRVDGTDLVAAGLTALEEATVNNVEFSGNQMTALLMLVGANDDPATWGDYSGSPDPRTSTDHDIFYAPLTITFNQIVAPPATTVYVDAVWTSQGNVTPGLFWGWDAFASIQDGIDNVALGGTVIVEAGAYNENVVIPAGLDNLKLIGAGSGVTSIVGTGGGSTVTLDVIDGFIIKGFTLVTADPNLAFNAMHSANLVLMDIVVNGGKRGIGLSVVQEVILIDVHISNTTTNGAELAGVSDLYFIGGSIVGNNTGVFLDDEYPNGDIHIHFSSLTGNAMAVKNRDSGTVIDATYNWWGSATGPTHANNPSGTGDPVSDYVDFSPWLGRSYDSFLMLENKDPSTWQIIRGDDIRGFLLYNSSGPEFEYSFSANVNGTGNYDLIYYADQPDRYVNWGGDNPGALIATFTADGNGDIAPTAGSVDLGMSLPCAPDANMDVANHDYSGPPDFYDHATGAKIWLVPSSDWDAGSPDRLIAWNPGQYLFETDLITYTDTGSVVVTTVNVPKIISISVTPPGLDFGTVMPGDTVTGDTITVRNTGTVLVDVDADLDRPDTVFDYLWLAGWEPPSNWGGIDGLVGGEFVELSTELHIPREYQATGLETATLIFWATASSLP